MRGKRRRHVTFFRSRVHFSHHSLMRLHIIPTCIRHNVPNYLYTKLCACLLSITICPYLRAYHCAYGTVVGESIGSLQVVVCRLYGFCSVDPSYLTRLSSRRTFVLTSIMGYVLYNFPHSKRRYLL